MMPRAKQRTPQLKKRVLAVAVATLATDGVAEFTTRRIAGQAETSTSAVYELFGDKAGLVRQVFFEGFWLLRRRFDELEASNDPRADLVQTLDAVRRFVKENPVIAQLMFSRPFAEFEPGPDDLKAGASVREFIVGRVRRFADGCEVDLNAVDAAHVLLAVVQGLAGQEVAGWLGTSPASINRRWALAIRAVLDGLTTPPSAG
jgi:AcrR family transcriptional regulator